MTLAGTGECGGESWRWLGLAILMVVSFRFPRDFGSGGETAGAEAPMSAEGGLVATARALILTVVSFRCARDIESWGKTVWPKRR
jgi:hypothetical protein